MEEAKSPPEPTPPAEQMQLKIQTVFYLNQKELLLEDRRNVIDFEKQMVNFIPELQQKFQNGVFVGSIILKVWNKAVARAKKKYSPRTIL